MSPSAVVPGALGPEQRARALEALAEDEFDLLVIGGGATGCGAALDAASRGLRVALVEQHDWSSGTSSRSSKLVHGGLRYLEQFRFRLVLEALRERSLLLGTLAPHLVRPVSYLYPLSGGRLERAYVGAGIGLYDLMGSVLAPGAAVPWHRHFSHTQSLALAPGLAPTALTGGVRFWDGQMDDSRLNLALARTAAEYGAVVTSGTPVVNLLRRGERIAGAVVHDEATDARIYVRAKAVLGAVGVWTEQLYGLTGALGPSPLQVRASKGVHIVVPGSAIDADTGLILRARRSVLFVTPWGENWLIGTTDTDWSGDLQEPAVTAADIRYLLGQANSVLARPLADSDILASFAGLRPLVDTSAPGPDGETLDSTQVGREHAVAELAPGLTAVAGGKWTTYRIMARDAVDAALYGAGWTSPPRSRTARIELSGARAYPAAVQAVPELMAELGLPREIGTGLAEWHGANAHEVVGLLRESPELRRRVEGAPDYFAAEVAYACRFEGARHLADVLDRRLRVSLSGPVSTETRVDVARLMADALGWDQTRQTEELAAYEQRAAAMIAATTCEDDAAADAMFRAGRGVESRASDLVQQ